MFVFHGPRGVRASCTLTGTVLYGTVCVLFAVLCLVLATRSPGQVLLATASVVRSLIGATLPDDFLGNGLRGGLRPQATGS